MSMIAIQRTNISINPARFEWLMSEPVYTHISGEIESVSAQWTANPGEALDVSYLPLGKDWADDLGADLVRFGDAPATPLEARPDPIVRARERERQGGKK